MVGYKRSADGEARISVDHSSMPHLKPITEAEVLSLQSSWGNAIVAITEAYQDFEGDFVKVASDAAAELYGYGHFKVLFKPTKAAENPFRPTETGAMSYFVGGSAVKGGFSEDSGFAINGGKGWSHVKFENHGIDLNGEVAFAMGHYFFTCATSGDVSKVEYTFGYKRAADGKARIFVHHSSVPYQKPSPARRQLRHA